MGKSFRVVTIYSSVLLLVIVAGQQLLSLTEGALLQYDALHYQTISKEGYFGVEVAFFPLFPLVWKLLHLSPLGISVFNGIVYFSAACFLFSHLKMTVKEKVLCLLTPGLVFFITPYSESLFFFSAVLMLVGINKKNHLLTLVGLLLCSVSRPSFTVILPALVLMELFSDHAGGKWKRIGAYIIVTALGGLIVAVIQYADTGKWFEYFSVQSVWDNALRFPSLPLRSWNSQSVIMLDGIALLIGAVSGVVLLVAMIRKKAEEMPDILKLSLAYLAGMALIVLFFRGGSLFSLNRFIFCSPFFFVAVVAFWRSSYRFSTAQLVMIFFTLIVYWLLFNSFVHIQTFLKYAAVSAACLCMVLPKHKHMVTATVGYYLLVVVLFSVQIIFLFRYLNGDWVG